jgi:hypothetical protein
VECTFKIRAGPEKINDQLVARLLMEKVLTYPNPERMMTFMTRQEIAESDRRSRIARAKAIREQGPISHEEALAQARRSLAAPPYVPKRERLSSAGQSQTEK